MNGHELRMTLISMKKLNKFGIKGNELCKAEIIDCGNVTHEKHSDKGLRQQNMLDWCESLHDDLKWLHR